MSPAAPMLRGLLLSLLVVATAASPVAPPGSGDESDALQALRSKVTASEAFQAKVAQACKSTTGPEEALCGAKASSALLCQLLQRSSADSAASLAAEAHCSPGNRKAPSSAGTALQPLFLEVAQRRRAAPPAEEEELAKEMTHDLEMNFNKIAPFGKEDTAKELQDHAAKTQDTLVDAVENAEVAEIKRAVFRALTRLRAATIKEFDTIARLETQAIDAYNDAHHYRAENPLAHLHEDEAPVETDKLKSFH